MSWNYRVMRRTERDETIFAIHEVYYEKDGAIKAWSADPVHPQGETFGELTEDIAMYQRAFTKRVLDIRDDGLYEIGYMGHTRKPVQVWKRSEEPQSDDAVGQRSV